MKTVPRWSWAAVLAVVIVAGTGSVAAGAAVHGQWDIVTVHDGNAAPGGVAFAMANDGTAIAFTGSGTFVVPSGDSGKARAVTGGGTWEISSLAGEHDARGTYAVTELVLFQPGPPLPAGVPLPVNDLVGNPEEAGAGLVVLRIAYSDGSDGTLVVSSRLEGTQDGVFQDETAMMFEGVTATKGAAGFWRNLRIGGSNRTLLHFTQGRRP